MVRASVVGIIACLGLMLAEGTSGASAELGAVTAGPANGAQAAEQSATAGASAQRVEPPAPAPAPVVARPPSPFDRGRVRLSFGAGGGIYGGQSFFAIEGGVGYFVLHGLEVGVDVTQWVGSDPTVTQVSPQLRYVFDAAVAVKPYLGVFYRRWFLWQGEPDVDALGGRGGVIWLIGGRAYFGLGAAYERVVSSCSADCWALYPEATLAIAF